MWTYGAGVTGTDPFAVLAEHEAEANVVDSRWILGGDDAGALARAKHQLEVPRLALVRHVNQPLGLLILSPPSTQNQVLLACPVSSKCSNSSYAV